MGSPFLELYFGYGVKVKDKSEVKGKIRDHHLEFCEIVNIAQVATKLILLS